MYGIDFYPTKPSTIEKLLDGVDFRLVKTVLEPSTGDGAIVDYIKEKTEKIHSYKKIKLDIDCIEIDENLRYILLGKNYRVISDDFLRFNTLKAYDLIVMNPPFNNQEYHIKKALDMLLESGGELRAITNSTMIKNPFSNIRKEIINILNSNNAVIEFLEEEFLDARRETSVEIAIIKCKIEKKQVG
uniref:methyltransferase n=1 Tax=Clostridium sp. TaxID=1506 RepID=UPI0026322989